MSERDPGFELHIALRRLRNEMLRSFPPLVFARWMLNKHPRMVVPFASALFLCVMAMIATDATW